MKTALIFGASGQDGVCLRALLEREGYQVIGLCRRDEGDVKVWDLVARMVEKYRPAQIYQLAASSTTKHEAVFDNHATIATGTLNVLEAVRVYSPDSKVFVCGSSIQFAHDGAPIHESHPFCAANPYAIARIHAAYTARYYRTLGISAYTGYLFHHESPERDERHLSQKIVRAAARIAQGSKERLALGNIDVVKEWGYAPDIMRGAMHLLSQDHIFEALIGTGEGHAVSEWLSKCFQFFDLDWRDHVDLIPGFVPEYKVMISDPSTMHQLGWTHQTSFDALARIMCQRALDLRPITS